VVMKITKALLTFFFVSLVAFAYADDKSKTDSHDAISDDLKPLITQYMDRVFGDNIPKLRDYYSFEGWHSEVEYDMEISICKSRFGNPQNLTNKQYAETIPKECRDWVSNRHDHSEKHDSLYYASIRKKFNKFPLKYHIQSIEKKGQRFLVSLVIPEEKAILKLNVYRSITDPELMIIEINSVIKK
jgi:hypothetical protein